MKFRYEAKTKEGETQVGYVEAGSQDGAVNLLAGHDLFILKIEAAETTHWFSRLSRYFTGVRRQDLVVATRQLATLLGAQLSLNRALSTLEIQTENPTLKEAVRQVARDVDAGLSFSQALERQGEVFSGFFVSMIRSAEVTGNLDKVASFLADYTEREYILATKARSALVYPSIIIGLFVLVAGIMVTLVFPQIQPIFEQSGIELPFLSKTLITAGLFVAKWWLVILLSLVVVIAIFLDYLQTPEGRGFLDDMKVRLPVVRKIYLPLTVTRFANASAMLIRGGVPVTQAMEVVGETVDNVLYRDILHEVAEDIRKGVSLSEAIGRHPDYFPVLIPEMLAVGEATGQLDQIFDRISIFYGREADATVSNLVDLIQPVLMIFVGLLVGLLFASMLLPLYRLTSTIQ